MTDPDVIGTDAPATAPRPLVTIGIPTYNRAATTLQRVLDVARAQTYPEIEIIVSDNASSDDTASAMADLDDPRVTFIAQPVNLGANGNFNFLVEAARGEFLLLLHDDDAIDPDFIERCVAALANQPDARLIRTGARIAKDGRVVSKQRNDVVGLDPASFFLAYFAGRTSIYFCSTLFHTQSLRDLGGLHSRHELLEDCVTVTEFVKRYPRIDIVEPLATFHRHGQNRGMTQAIELWADDSLDLLERMCAGSGERSQEVREVGLRFFTWLNYNRLYRNGSRDLRKYRAVYQAFERTNPLWRFFYDRWIGRRTNRVLRKLSRMAAST